MDINQLSIERFYQVTYDSGSRQVKELSGPINFNIILTKRCNANCIHCCASANEDHEEFSLENIKKLIHIAEKNNVFYFVLTGGEPLLYKHFWETLDLCKGNVGIVINSNGTLITENIARKLKERGVGNVHISLDAIDEQTYAQQRGNTTSLHDVLSGIKNLVSVGVPVTTKIVITAINKDKIHDVIKTSIKLGVKKVSIAWFKPVGRGLINENSLELSLPEIKKIMKEIYLLKDHYKQTISLSFDDAQCFPFLLKELKSIKYNKLCGDYFCRIDPKGDVYPCPFLNIHIGNIFEEDISKLWKSKKLRELRNLSHGKNLNGRCTRCNHNDICLGGCRARALYVNGDLYSQDPLCWVR
jgi:radical SAM protein with 4Fe4S-binding SPASM domain